jgi:hypothetical protein
MPRHAMKPSSGIVAQGIASLEVMSVFPAGGELRLMKHTRLQSNAMHFEGLNCNMPLATMHI